MLLIQLFSSNFLSSCFIKYSYSSTEFYSIIIVRIIYN